MTDTETNLPSSLGDAIRQLHLSAHGAEEKTRIHHLLADQNTKAHRRTRKWCLSNKTFEKRSRRWSREIKGFRVNHWRYKVEAFAYMVRQMENDQRAIGWMFYEKAYIDYLVKDKIELGQLLAQEECKDQTSSDDLIRAVINKAPQYKVTANDISDLYENWYFKRNKEFDQWIQGLERVGRSIENQRHISEIESDLDELKKDISQLNRTLKKKESDEKDFNLLTSQLKDVQTSFDDVLKDIRNKFTDLSKNQIELNEIARQLKTGEKKLRTNQKTLKLEFEKSISKSHDYIDEKITTNVKITKKSIHELASSLNQRINKLDLRPPQDVTEKQGAAHYRKKNMTILRTGAGLTEISIDEQQFLSTYQSSLKFSGIETTTKISVLNHCILKSSDVICCKSLDIVDSWIQALNWEQHVLEAAADPNWTNYAAWQDVVTTFLSNPRIRILVLHSYNTGYIDGYLKPFLLLFRRERHAHKKIILVETENTSKPPLPRIGLALIDNHKKNIFKDPSVIFKNINPVSLDSFNEWLIVKSEESEDHASDICQNLIDFAANENINMQTVELEGIYHVLCAYLESGLALNKETKILLLTKFLSNLWEEDFVNKFIEGI